MHECNERIRNDRKLFNAMLAQHFDTVSRLCKAHARVSVEDQKALQTQIKAYWKWLFRRGGDAQDHSITILIGGAEKSIFTSEILEHNIGLDDVFLMHYNNYGCPQTGHLLHYFAEDGCESVLNFLLAFGVNIEAKIGFQKTALLHVVITGNETSKKIVDCLLSWGADINATSSSGASVIHYACIGAEHYNRPPEVTVDALKHLINHGADFSIVNNEGQTPLSLLFSSSKPGIVEAVLKDSFDPRVYPFIRGWLRLAGENTPSWQRKLLRSIHELALVRDKSLLFSECIKVMKLNPHGSHQEKYIALATSLSRANRSARNAIFTQFNLAATERLRYEEIAQAFAASGSVGHEMIARCIKLGVNATEFRVITQIVARAYPAKTTGKAAAYSAVAGDSDLPGIAHDVETFARIAEFLVHAVPVSSRAKVVRALREIDGSAGHMGSVCAALKAKAVNREKVSDSLFAQTIPAACAELLRLIDQESPAPEEAPPQATAQRAPRSGDASWWTSQCVQDPIPASTAETIEMDEIRPTLPLRESPLC